MKNSILVMGVLCLALISCKKTPKTVPTTVNETPKEKALVAINPDVDEGLFEPKTKYVIAPSGLTLRSGSNLNSKKVLRMPYGSELLVTNIPEHTQMTVAAVEGAMHRVNFQGVEGFAFSGYLSNLVPPTENEEPEAYANRVKALGLEVVLKQEQDPKGAFYGSTTALDLPATTWNEAFTIAHRLFDLTTGIEFPKQSALRTQVVESKTKREKVWKDQLEVTRDENGMIEQMTYTYAIDGYSRTIEITPSEIGFLLVEREGMK
ncbi:hypothetical protein [Croceiramulus getboli]|nr:hypothetical protein P8624_05075 [Flavobacteriaceae bacterium YJPT1-3]